MEQIQDLLNEDRLTVLKMVRMFMEDNSEPWDGTLEQAKRMADEITKKYGIRAMVIKKHGKYDWVTEYYFDIYKHKGNIYYETTNTDI